MNGTTRGKTWTCGTLTYTKAGLAALFIWLLWGDFCYTLMESVIPSVLPLKLKALGTPNWLMGVILTTGPSVIAMGVGPWVSFKSDRYRSRWGRRLPFIFTTMPFLCLFLVLLGWSDEVARFLLNVSPAMRELAPATLTIGLIAVFILCFRFFDMFLNSVFWYLFNDVVPAPVLGRFMGTLRLVGTGAGALYNWFIFKYANTHMREIFTGAALIYFIGFGMLCLLVKEGEYPPLEGETDKDSKGGGGFRTYFRESFCCRFYWYRFLATCSATIGCGIGMFGVFFNQQMGLSLEQIGRSTAISQVVMMCAIFFMATFIDRWHPLRLTTYTSVFWMFGALGSGVWLFVTLPGDYYFWISVIEALSGTVMVAMWLTARLPTEMRIFPHSRFGQFCSAQSLLANGCGAVAGVLAGFFIDLTKWFCHGSDYAYRFMFVWTGLFAICTSVLTIKLYREWHRLGGDRHFHPPAPWSPKGFEEMPVTPTIGPQSKWLKITFFFFDVVMVLSVVATPVLMWWMQMHGALFACKWYGLIVLPLSVLACVAWFSLKRSILRDITAARAGKPLRNGIPHHGLVLLVAIQFLILFALWIAEVVITISMKMETGSVAFGVGRVVSNFTMIGALWTICRMERGYSNQIDVKWVAAESAIPASTANGGSLS